MNIRCPVCGMVTACPGNPPPGVRAITDRELLIISALEFGPGRSWEPRADGSFVDRNGQRGVVTHRRKRWWHCVVIPDGYKLLIFGTGMANRAGLHGWPPAPWVGQCRYGVFVPADYARGWFAGAGE